jgi:hypothetical protein
MISREPLRGWRGIACRTIAVVFGLAPVFVGCGPPSPYVRVQGTVMIDGKPLESGIVQFHPPAGQVAAGEIGPGGAFTLTTRSPGDGVLPGTYQATVTAESADPAQQSLIPLRYTRAGSSGLSVTIFPDSKAPVKLELVSDGPAAEDAGTTGGADREQSQSPTAD